MGKGQSERSMKLGGDVAKPALVTCMNNQMAFFLRTASSKDLPWCRRAGGYVSV